METTRRTLGAVAAAVLAACGGSGGAPEPGLRLGGGKGTAGAGGAGGALTVISAGGPVTLTTSGALPAAPAWANAPPALGANPRTITGAVTLTPAGGAIVGDDGATAATGLRVAPGATLTLAPDQDGPDADALPDQVNLSFTDGLLIEGTLRLGRANGGAGAAGWSGGVGALAIRPGGRLLATGDAGSAAVDGGAGGAIELAVAGACSVEGLLDTRGGPGRAGGAGGAIDLVVSDGDLMISGTSDSSGGEGLAGPGGAAGPNEIWGVWADAGTGGYWLTGAVLARGGAGTAGGGRGGWIYGSSCRIGEAFVSGLADTSGGDATVEGRGGAAETLEFYAASGRVLVGGRLRARGGHGAGAGAGGVGGWIGLSSQALDATLGRDTSVVVKADVDVRGGDGTTGVRAGELEVWAEANATGPNPVTLIAQAADLGGGAGATVGGAGGAATLYANRGDDAASTWRIGAVRLGIPLDLRGGAAAAGTGGEGGRLAAESYGNLVAADLDVPAADRAVAVSAPVDASGGAGATGGAGGLILGFEHRAVELTAALTASGGAATTGAGGAGGFVTFTCDAVVKAGTITADGGGSAGGAGGQGGSATLTSFGGSTARSGVVSVRGGAGATPGATGSVTLDGAAASLTGGQLRP